MELREIYPSALVFEDMPEETNFVIGQIILVKNEGKAYLLDNRKAGKVNWIEIKE